jgi:predicted short-subunit dehydrogenase-like oxidoreductase (DUF2520 family)
VNKPRVSIIGSGRVGTALAKQLHILGYPLGVLVARSLLHAEAAVSFVGAGQPHTDVRQALADDVVFLTVPDTQIAVVCAALAKGNGWSSQHLVVHCSGALGTEVLADAQQTGAAVLSLHPLLSISDPATGVQALPGAHFALEGCARGMQFGRTLVAELGGTSLEVISGGKPLYHAAAALASNGLAALLDMVLELLAAVGVTGDDAIQAVCALAEGTIANIGREGLPEALTGPVERGDAATVAKHLATLPSYPLILETYKALSQRALQMSENKGSAAAADIAVLHQLLDNKVVSER